MRLVDRPRHVVFAPLEGIFAQLLFFRIAILGRHFLPCLILFLIFLVGSVLFILLPALVLTLVILFLVLSMTLSLSWPLRALISAAMARIFSSSGDLVSVSHGSHGGMGNEGRRRVST